MIALSLAACSAQSTNSSGERPSAPAPASTATAIAPPSNGEIIAQPTLHLGDLWVDRIQGTDREFRIEEIHGDTMDVSYWGIEQTTDRNLNIIVYRSLTESSSEPTVSTKPGMWFEFPLYPGKTWVSDFDWETKGASPTKGQGEDRGRAIGWEDVQVPAGTFHALKVEVVSRFFGKGGMADEATLVFWYSPKVNRFVKFDYRSFYEGEMVAELVKYKPAAAS
ncbi:MAG TPA: hypothetical protein VMT64_03390 [Candidatus Binataceae bacterium]|nr:hypothetical protein [Candidatus Binataceae bacterium]